MMPLSLPPLFFYIGLGIIGGALGGLLWIILLYRKIGTLSLREQNLKDALTNALFNHEKAVLESAYEKNLHTEQISAFERAHAALEDHIKVLCSDVLSQTQTQFLTQAESLMGRLQHMTQGALGQQHEKLNFLISPVATALQTIGDKIQLLEKNRVGAYESISQQLGTLSTVHKDLSQQTSQLLQALRTPHIRGRWGEIQLRRLVELAGMLPQCDFLEQPTSFSESTLRASRPDLLIMLPGNKNIVIDAKVPLLSYLEGIEASDTQLYKKHMKDHARHMRGHIKTLSQKAYWAQFSPSPEFVLLFLPSENLLTSALEEDKEILDYGAESRVLIATPMTLLALLKTIALGWHQQSFSDNAEKITLLGRDVYRRLNDVLVSFGKMGQYLRLTHTHYHTALKTLEQEVLPSSHALGNMTEIGGVSPAAFSASLPSQNMREHFMKSGVQEEEQGEICVS